MLLERSRRVTADVTADPDGDRHDGPDTHHNPTTTPADDHDHDHAAHFHVTSHATGKRHLLHDVLDLLGLLLVGVVAWVLWPASLGGSTHIIVVQGHSMEPVFHLGDAIIVKENHDPKIGDIIVFHVPEGEPGAGSLVVHRIIEFRGDGTIMTRGDNRRTADPFRIRQEDIVGTPAWTLPHVGRMIGLASTPWVVALSIGLVSLLVLLPGGKKDEEPDGEADKDDGASPEMDEAQRRRWRNGRRPVRAESDALPATTPDIGPAPSISPAVAERVRSLREPQTLELPLVDPSTEFDDLFTRLGPDT